MEKIEKALLILSVNVMVRHSIRFLWVSDPDVEPSCIDDIEICVGSFRCLV